MLKVESHEGKMKAALTGTTMEICAEVGAVIYEISKQITRPHEETAQKLFVIKMLRATINYSIKQAEKEVAEDDQA